MLVASFLDIVQGGVSEIESSSVWLGIWGLVRFRNVFGVLLNLGMHFGEGFAASFDQCLLSTLKFLDELGDGCFLLLKSIIPLLNL